MKKLLITLTAVLTAISVHAQQVTLYEGKVKIKVVELAQRGKDLAVNLSIRVDSVAVESRKSLDIIPVLTDGTYSKDLPEISIKGKRKYKEYRRQSALMRDKQSAHYAAPYAVKKGYGRKEGTLDYRYTMPFEEWMSNAYLNVQYDICGCGSGSRQSAMERLADNVSLQNKMVLTPWQDSPYLAFIKPEVEKIKRRDVEAEVFLAFAVNETNIRTEYMNNPKELKKIREMIDEIQNNPDIKVERLDIIGYASPEGTMENNKRLSEERAKSLRDYLVTQYDFTESLYQIKFGGENWNGLVRLVDNSDMEYKNEILDIIRSTAIDAGRKKKLTDLAGGRPYHYMVTNMFPKLRVAICRVTYNVRLFDVNEAKEIMKRRPQNLSLSEMYQVANTYEHGSEEFADVFETAARMFPEDETANLNAAVAALTRNDTVLAGRYLGKVKLKAPIPEYDNAVGVLELLNGNYEKAGKYFRAAEKAGLKEATLNLEELIKKQR
ncbi:MAG: DUF3868 domain-containing protein [Mangrovibacterium sp.]